MRCAWDELLRVLPMWMRQDVDRLGKMAMQELRLRLGLPPELFCRDGSLVLDRVVTTEDLSFVINAASRYSPWNTATAAQGYLTAPGGHRIGICGEVVAQGGNIQGIRRVRSLCIRVARDFPGISKGIPMGSVLILGKPGAGKTTLLRDLIRQRSESDIGSVAVVDERGELFPQGFSTGKRTDILTGCPKGEGILMLLRSMGPSTIAVDEITEEADALALMQAYGCGVELLATAHGSSAADLRNRPVYRKLLEAGIFETVVLLQSDKSWRAERIKG